MNQGGLLDVFLFFKVSQAGVIFQVEINVVYKKVMRQEFSFHMVHVFTISQKKFLVNPN